MLAAKNNKGVLVYAHHAIKEERYYCPVCEREVVLRQGNIKRPHFAHVSTLDCFKQAYKAESSDHIYTKYWLYDFFNERDTALEHYLQEIEQIPDVFLFPNAAFEVQYSKIPSSIMRQRTEGYQSLQINCFWMIKYNDLQFKKGVLKLTYFQLAAVHPKFKIICAFDMKTSKFYMIHLVRMINQFMFEYRMTEMSNGNEFFNSLFSCYDSQPYFLSLADKRNYINNCIRKKSVLEPSLSAIYQLGFNRNNLPDTIGIIIPEQIYIGAHPIEWQLELLRMIMSNTFSLTQFTKSLKLHHALIEFMTVEELVYIILKSYECASQFDVQKYPKNEKIK